MSGTEESYSDLDNSGVKAVITLGVLFIAGVISAVVAKTCQYCRKKRLIADDDESDISEHTRGLIRARLSVIQFKKSEIKKANKARNVGVVRKWIQNVRDRKKDREDTLKSQRPVQNGKEKVVISTINTDSVICKENGILELENGKVVKENGTPRIARFPSFSRSKAAGGASKPQDVVRTVEPVSVISERGRPVSSKSHALPNVTVTDVEVNSVQKVHVKSVHFDGDLKSKSDQPVTPTVSVEKPVTLDVDRLVSQSTQTNISKPPVPSTPEITKIAPATPNTEVEKPVLTKVVPAVPTNTVEPPIQPKVQADNKVTVSTVQEVKTTDENKTADKT